MLVGRGQERRGHRPRWAQVSSLSLLRGSIHRVPPVQGLPGQGVLPRSMGSRQGAPSRPGVWVCGPQGRAFRSRDRNGVQTASGDALASDGAPRPAPSLAFLPCRWGAALTPLSRGYCPAKGQWPLSLSCVETGAAGWGSCPSPCASLRTDAAVSATLPRVSASRNYHREPQVSPVSDMVGALTGEGLGDGPLWQAGPGPEAAP